jgi:hypothetical protein
MRTLCLVLLLAACKEEKILAVTLGDPDIVPLAFRCRDDESRIPLVARAYDSTSQTVRVAMVYDFIHLGGLPGCRNSQIASWCEKNDCQPMPQRRRCKEIEVPIDFNPDPGENIRAVLAELPGAVLTEDAPDEPVIIRLVAVAKMTCDELGQDMAFPEESVVGCAISCPVQLDYVEGAVLLDLPAVGERCEGAVTSCAGVLR